jgi:hypothetical protein
MKRVVTVLTLAFVLAMPRSAQAEAIEVVDGIVAQVNNDVISRSDYQKALLAFRGGLTVQMPGKTDAEIDTELERLKSNVLDSLIDDRLLEQQSRELGLEADVDGEVNREMLQLARDINLKSVEELEDAMRNNGLDFNEARSDLRKYFQHQFVLEREVLQPLVNGGATREQVKEQAEAARKQYLTKLRDEAFIKIMGTPARLVAARNVG